MNNRSNAIELLRQRINQLEITEVLELNELLDRVSTQFQRQESETKRLGKAQAEAIVRSAAIISELEETQTRLEASRREAEAATCEVHALSAFGDILENSLNEIYIFDVETLLFLHANRGARENIGYSMEELRQITPVDIKPDQSFASFNELISPLKNGEVENLHFKTVHCRKDGTKYPVQVHLEMSVLGESPVFAAVILDITERIALENRLRETTERAIVADRMKSEFLANMSHEIRTPMTAILGFSEFLLEEGVLQEEQRDAIQTIHRNGQHLLEIINDILDLSKVESGKLEIERRKLNPEEFLSDIFQLLSERARSRNNQLQIEIDREIPNRILSDPTRLKQALLNLAGNAIKFTQNGIVRIVVECDQQRELMSFHVIDSGIGMSASQLERIFQPFCQADSSTTRKYGGTGLGLTITKQIAGLLGGDVSVESQPGFGSRFTLTVATGSLAGVQMVSTLLDGRLSGPGKTQQTSTQDQTGINGRVLLVEDGPDNQRLIRFILQKAGADVTLAENGKLGLDAALSAQTAGNPFDLILMDMQMPVMDGYTATALLRESGYRGQIIALTAHAMKGEIDKCLSAGCDAYLSKPIDRKTFLAEISSRINCGSIKTGEQQKNPDGLPGCQMNGNALRN